MSNDTKPARIKVYVYQQKMPFLESLGPVLRVSDHREKGVEPSTWYNADLVDALIDAAMGQIETGGCVREILSAVDAIREGE